MEALTDKQIEYMEALIDMLEQLPEDLTVKALLRVCNKIYEDETCYMRKKYAIEEM